MTCSQRERHVDHSVLLRSTGTPWPGRFYSVFMSRVVFKEMVQLIDTIFLTNRVCSAVVIKLFELTSKLRKVILINAKRANKVDTSIFVELFL